MTTPAVTRNRTSLPQSNIRAPQAPPANATVFSVDEKPQIQALGRTATVLPMLPGVPEGAASTTPGTPQWTFRRAEHRCWQGHRQAIGPVPAVDFRDFLDQIDRQTDPGLDVHVICDNLSAHKAPAVHRWLLAHPRFVLHFTPTYSSWINQVERWLAELQRRCLERGVFCSLGELTSALEEWIKLWNESARPFRWTKTADQIIDRICRYCSRISEPGHQ